MTESGSLSWPELRGRNYGAAGRSLVATLHFSSPSGERTERVWFDPPKSWRIESDAVVTQIQNPEATYFRQPDGSMDRQGANTITMWAGDHPGMVVEGYRFWSFDERLSPFLTPVTEPERTSVDGRAAWEVWFRSTNMPGSEHNVTFDGATGLVLRWDVPSEHRSIRVLEFELDPDIAPETFVWDGLYTSEQDTRWKADQLKRQRLAQMDKPVPTYWPVGYTADVVDGNPDSGEVMMQLSVARGAQLARWPVRSPEPGYLGYGHGYEHEYRWKAHGWKWCLRTAYDFTDDELKQFKATLPHQEPTQTPLLRATDRPGPDPTSGTGTSRIYHGPINIEYGQFYVLPADTLNPDPRAAYAGQRNGLCGSAIEGSLFLSTGGEYGAATLTVDLADSEPPVDDTWEDIVEAPLTVIAEGGLWVSEWGGEAAPADVPLQPGQYRVRYSARGMDRAHQGEDTDEYALTFWPAATKPDAVLKQTSAQAAYFHTAWK